MASYDTLSKKQAELIRKATDGSVFIAPASATGITTLTVAESGTGATTVIGLSALPTDWADLGYLTEDGVGFTRDVSTSEVTSWQSVTPTRTDITADTTTISVTAQETNIYTIGLATGMDIAGLKATGGAVNTAEVTISKPARPSQKFYRLLTLAVDENESGKIYIGRYFPRVRVTAFGDQSFSGGDGVIEWPVTLQALHDSTAGYSERWLLGGPGWKSSMTSMGFDPVT